MTTPPRWDLTNVYPSLDSKEFEASVKKVKKQIGDLEKFFDKNIDKTTAKTPVKKLAGLAGEAIDKPTYSFKEGRRTASKRIRLEPDQILLLDCLHGLYPPITEGIDAPAQFRHFLLVLREDVPHPLPVKAHGSRTAAQFVRP